MSLRRSSWLALVAVLAPLAGCGSTTTDLVPRRDGALAGDADATGDAARDGQSPACGAQDVVGLELEPADAVVLLDGGPAEPLHFTARARLAGGETLPLAAEDVEWAVTREDDTDPGTIGGGIYRPNPAAGGTVLVTARACGASGSTTVRFRLETVIGQPSDPAAWTGEPTPGTPAAPAPEIVYPSSETRFPRNLHRALFQWQAAGLSEFRLVFRGPAATVTVYTDGLHPLCKRPEPMTAAGCWQADADAWLAIAGSNAGATATVTVDGLDRSQQPPVVRRSQPIVLGFSRRDVRGAIFYWSTTSAGIRRASLAAEAPEDYLVGKPAGTMLPDGDRVVCVGCHTVSRNGTYLLAPTRSDQTNSLWIAQVTPTVPPLPLIKEIPGTDGHGFATISPDDTRVVAAWGGTLRLLDRATGQAESVIDTGMLEATHPDWSPDDTQLVFVTRMGDAPGGADLAVLPWNGATFGAPRILVSRDGASLSFPMFSFDGRFIAYARGRGGHGDPEAQLWIVDRDGSLPVELVNANRVVNQQVTDGKHQNSQPTWAPPGDIDWVAFSSHRAFGLVRPAGTQQIWVAAVDLQRVARGEDGSYPAFRLPLQNLDEHNHRAFWTLDVREPPPVDGPPPDGGTPDGGTPDGGLDGGRACVPTGQGCDQLADVCCDPAAVCDTRDDGRTYSCVPLRPMG